MPIRSVDCHRGHNLYNKDSMMIDPSQLDQLSSLLLSSASLQTLCLVSPISLLESPASLSPLAYSSSCSSKLLEILFSWVHSQSPSTRSMYRRQVTVISPGRYGITAAIHGYDTNHLISKVGHSSTSVNQADISLPLHILNSYQAQVTMAQIYVGNSSSSSLSLSVSPSSLLSSSGKLFILKPLQSTSSSHCALINLSSSAISWRQKLLQDPTLTDHILNSVPDDQSELETVDMMKIAQEESSLHLFYTHYPVYLMKREGLKHFTEYLNRKNGLKKRIPMTFQRIWKSIEDLLKTYHTVITSSSSPAAAPVTATKLSDASSHLKISPTVLSIFNTLELICRRCDILYQYGFTQYTQSLLPKYLTSSATTPAALSHDLPISSPHQLFTLPSSLLTLLTSLYLSLIHLLPVKYRSIFPPPNLLLFSFLWDHFLAQILPGTDYHLLSEDRQTTITSHEIITHLLPQKPEYFYQLCRLLMICHGLYGPVREENQMEEREGELHSF